MRAIANIAIYRFMALHTLFKDGGFGHNPYRLDASGRAFRIAAQYLTLGLFLIVFVLLFLGNMTIADNPCSNNRAGRNANR